MIAIDSLLTDFASALNYRFNINATPRYFRVGDVSELSSTALKWYVELGRFSLERVNVSSPVVRQQVRLIAERSCAFSELPAVCKSTIGTLENIARTFAREGRAWTDGAFLERVDAFSDAPNGLSVEPAESGASAVFGGLEFTFIIC